MGRARTRHCGRFVRPTSLPSPRSAPHGFGAHRTQVCRQYTYRHDLCVGDESRGTVSSPVAKVVTAIIGHPAWIVQIVQRDVYVLVAEASSESYVPDQR